MVAPPRRFLLPSGPVELARILEADDRGVAHALAGHSDVAIARALSNVHAEDAGRVLRVLPPERAGRVFELLSASEAAAVLPHVPVARQPALFRKLQRDEQADVVPHLPEDVRDRLLKSLPVEDRRELKVLLKYPPEHLASIMTVNVPTFREDWTVAEAIAHARAFADDEDVTLHYLYVVDALDRLVGVLSIRDLLNLKGDKRLGDACHRDLTVLHLGQDPEEAARTALATDWRSVPVLDPDGRLAGVLTDEDANAYLNVETTEDFQRFGGMEPIESAYLRASVRTLLQKRVGWLFLLFVVQLSTSFILSAYEAALAAVVALSFFIPVLVSTGGNVGSQSSSLLIRALALGEITPRQYLGVATKEGVTGLGLGVVMAAVAVVRVVSLEGSWPLAAVVAVSIVAVCVLAAVIGGVLPLLVHRLGGDPALMSAPFIATVVDAVGILLYMGLAVAILGL